MSALTARVLDLLPEARLHHEAASDRSLVVFGPPGTGKTTSMLRLVEAHLAAGACGPDTLAILTFTRNAQAEALGRLKRTTGLGAAQWPWVRTIHSACFRLLGLRPQVVMTPWDYQEFGRSSGYRFTTGQHHPDDPMGGTQTLGDWLLAAEELRRARRMSIAEAARSLQPPPGSGEWDEEIAGRFAAALIDYKRQRGVHDYTDMLELVLREGLRPSATHFFVDEVQDLSPLQFAVLDLWTARARRLFAFGDDDQACYSWAGADPLALMSRSGHRVVLSKTHRLPSDIHAEALRLVQRIRTRVPKVFEPVAPGGMVDRLKDWGDAAGLTRRGGSYMILARNRMYLEGAREELCRQATPFLDRTGEGGVPDPGGLLGRAVRAVLDLSRGDQVRGCRALRDLRGRIWKDLWPHDRIPKRAVVGLDGLEACGANWQLVARLRSDPLGTLRMDPAHRGYLSRLVGEYGLSVLDEKPCVQVSTIHGVKGEEADHVVVCTAMTPQTRWSYRNDPDSEHRVMYVGATRAKKSLSWLELEPDGYEL